MPTIDVIYSRNPHPALGSLSMMMIFSSYYPLLWLNDGRSQTTLVPEKRQRGRAQQQSREHNDDDAEEEEERETKEKQNKEHRDRSDQLRREPTEPRASICIESSRE